MFLEGCLVLDFTILHEFLEGNFAFSLLGELFFCHDGRLHSCKITPQCGHPMPLRLRASGLAACKGLSGAGSLRWSFLLGF